MTEVVKGNDKIREALRARTKVPTKIVGATRVGAGADSEGKGEIREARAPDDPVALSVLVDDDGATLLFEPTRRVDWRRERGHTFRLDRDAVAALVEAIAPPSPATLGRPPARASTEHKGHTR